MEQLKRIDILVNLMYGNIEGQSVVDYLPQSLALHIVAEESIGNVACYLAKRQTVDMVKKRLRQLVYLLGHVKTAVLSETFHYGFL